MPGYCKCVCFTGMCTFCKRFFEHFSSLKRMLFTVQELKIWQNRCIIINNMEKCVCLQQSTLFKRRLPNEGYITKNL